jgi:hypothetical protein
MFVAGQIFNPVTTFHLYAIDVAHLYGAAYLPFGTPQAAFTLTFFGFQVRGANATVSQTFTVGAPASGVPLLNQLLFGPSWRDLYSVAWQQSTGTSGTLHQFTNVAAQVVPEPGTYALVGAGVLLLAGAGRRRAGGARA